jgi:hypothetical protein
VMLADRTFDFYVAPLADDVHTPVLNATFDGISDSFFSADQSAPDLLSTLSPR